MSIRASRFGQGAALGVCLDRAIAVAVASTNSETPAHVHLAALPTEHDAQVKKLSKLVTKLGMQGCTAALALPLGSYDMLQIERPAVEDDELVDAARWRVKEQLDYPIEDAVLQVFDAPQPSERQRTALINVVAAPARTVRELTMLLKKAGLRPGKITIAELAVRELIAQKSPRTDPVATVFLTTRQGIIQVTWGRELYLSRRVDYGLGSIKPSDSAATGIHMTLPLELRRTVDYFESHFSRGHVRRVLACPSDPAFMLLMKQASEFTGLEVEPLELPAELVQEEGKSLGFGLPEAYMSLAAALTLAPPVAQREAV
jgi:MSHA biogenesis protein MshI